MERRADIRAAMQSLLSPASRPESRSAVAPPRIVEEPPPCGVTPALSETQLLFVRELQATLRENGISAHPTEIMQAMLEALMNRPALCRGLLAAYLLEG